MKLLLAYAIVAAIVTGLLCMGLWLAQRDAAPARERWA